MTPVLLDTHVFVWALAEPARVPESAWTLLRDPRQPLRLSLASAWELAIKASAGRIHLPMRAADFIAEGCQRTGVDVLGVELSHIAELERLPWHHRDPFDRLIIAQARVESFRLLSFDGELSCYEFKRAQETDY
ncbi:MAG: type II toxin-antitoxin system VapC family toxin [Myxococcales bacterium]|nr:type II toxin-antitoxin system VapC family toxin [Myxococcales bacterium]